MSDPDRPATTDPKASRLRKRLLLATGVAVLGLAGIGTAVGLWAIRGSGVTVTEHDFSGFQTFEFTTHPVFGHPPVDGVYSATVVRNGDSLQLTLGMLRAGLEGEACLDRRRGDPDDCLVVVSEERSLSADEADQLTALFRQTVIEEEPDACKGFHADPVYLKQFRWDGEGFYDFFCYKERLAGSYSSRLIAFLEGAAQPPSAATPAATATTPAPTPSAQVAACPDDIRGCDFGLALAAAIRPADWNVVAALFQPTVLTCPGPPYLGLFDAACLDRAQGETVEAVYLGAFAKDGTRYAFDRLATELPRFVTEPAGYTLYAIGTPFRSDCTSTLPNPVDPDCRSIVLADRATGRALVIPIRSRGDEWSAESLLYGELALLVQQPGRMGQTYRLYDGTSGTWSGVITGATDRIEYDGAVSTPGECLNVREIPRLNGALVTCLPDETLVFVRDTATMNDGIEWVQVTALFEGLQIEGWAAKGFVKRR